jgi:hypothetical protein
MSALTEAVPFNCECESGTLRATEKENNQSEDRYAPNFISSYSEHETSGPDEPPEETSVEKA